MFVVHSHHCPLYLSESVASVSSHPVRRRLRSATGPDYMIPWTRTNFGDRAFAVAAVRKFGTAAELLMVIEQIYLARFSGIGAMFWRLIVRIEGRAMPNLKKT